MGNKLFVYYQEMKILEPVSGAIVSTMQYCPDLCKNRPGGYNCILQQRPGGHKMHMQNRPVDIIAYAIMSSR